RRVRTSFAGLVCPAMFLPTASGHAAQQSCSGVIISPDSFSPRMSLLARSMVGRILILSRRAASDGRNGDLQCLTELGKRPEAAAMGQRSGVVTPNPAVG